MNRQEQPLLLADSITSCFKCYYNVVVAVVDNVVLHRFLLRTLKTQLYFYGRPTYHTYPSRKGSFAKTLFKPDEFENAAFSCGRKTL